MKIRLATPKDLTAIKRLIAKFPKRLIQNPLPKASEFFVAELGGESLAGPKGRKAKTAKLLLPRKKTSQIVACCALEVYSRKIAEIRSLAVEPKYRGQGIATKLIRRCLQRARKLKVREVLAITGRPSLFSRLGFQPFHQERVALFKVFR